MEHSSTCFFATLLFDGLNALPFEVGMEAEGFAIYDAMRQLENEACLLLAVETKGKRFMMPHTKAMIQQPKVPSSGMMPASDVLICAKEENEQTRLKWNTIRYQLHVL
ncbi:ATP-dependent Clp protease proteolytic subunit-related protein 3, chloroplastic-like [Tripterygium wilfordii]|uniref:ATP-dependent Clp protease proteolytic subunit-related protein 3, chloroplastic-like n=1 Tax=Tripterygium wilfordii TaxID=458696 RepID=UPI0018F85EE4|nr:ATP-dependent Clp protease proteolytic subunit-related protein 3, chloroplastic-like [Tripterygium wilfordii]